ncbi:hypothetical protein [Clostridium beijerinckii]|uniref:hypothetical protein n=1 Tax=Clostridium beijerinckii TaxID=1520 RepID=UPI001F1C1F90|nr:hypothetical protein [Clostridium beijerinckii]
MYCCNCGKYCNERYKVIIVDHYGNEREEECCSEDCCRQQQDKSIRIHQQRADKVRYQSFQKVYY